MPVADDEEAKDWASCVDDDEGLPIPHKESETVTIWRQRDLPDIKFARVSEDRTARREKKAVYCYLHGCSKMRKPCLFPTNDQIAGWIMAGKEYPARTVANKRRHELEFDRIFPKK